MKLKLIGTCSILSLLMVADAGAMNGGGVAPTFGTNNSKDVVVKVVDNNDENNNGAGSVVKIAKETSNAGALKIEELVGDTGSQNQQSLESLAETIASLKTEISNIKGAISSPLIGSKLKGVANGVSVQQFTDLQKKVDELMEKIKQLTAEGEPKKGAIHSVENAQRNIRDFIGLSAKKKLGENEKSILARLTELEKAAGINSAQGEKSIVERVSALEKEFNSKDPFVKTSELDQKVKNSVQGNLGRLGINENFQKRLQAIEEEYQTLLNNNNELAQRFEAADIKALATKVTEIEAYMKRLHGTLSDVWGSIRDTQNNVLMLKDSQNNIANKQQQLDDKVSAVEGDVNDLQDDLVDQQEATDDLRKDVEKNKPGFIRRNLGKIAVGAAVGGVVLKNYGDSVRSRIETDPNFEPNRFQKVAAGVSAGTEFVKGKAAPVIKEGYNYVKGKFQKPLYDKPAGPQWAQGQMKDEGIVYFRGELNAAEKDAPYPPVDGVAVEGAGKAVGSKVAGVGKAVGGAVKAVGGAVKGAGKAVGSKVAGAGKAVGGAVKTVGGAVKGAWNWGRNKLSRNKDVTSNDEGTNYSQDSTNEEMYSPKSAGSNFKAEGPELPTYTEPAGPEWAQGQMKDEGIVYLEGELNSGAKGN